jgi:uncharacterized protein YndB with AHSA1/START domain
VSAADAVTVSIEVGVPPATAFEVFTAEMDTWWQHGPRYRFVAPYGGVMKLEPRVGGRLLHVHDPAAGLSFEVGRVRVWEPPARLVFSWRLDNFAPHEVTEVEVRFKPAAHGTLVTVTHRGWDSLPPAHPARHGQVGRAFVLFRGRWWADMLAAAKARAERAECEIDSRHSRGGHP